MKAIRVLKWMIYVVLILGALLDPENRSVLMTAFFTIASICSGLEITEKERRRNETIGNADGRLRDRSVL